MKRATLAIALLTGLAGCEGMKRQVVECCGGRMPCPAEISAPYPLDPGDCRIERPVRPARCRAPQVDVQETEEVVVRAPRQKVVVEAPVPCSSPAPAAAPCQAPAPAVPCQAPAVAAAPTYPQQQVPMMTTTVKQKTRLGLMFDTIRIPFPILRPMAVPQPAEVTTTMPVAPTTGMMPMMPMAAAPMMPMAMPMAPAMGMPMGGMPMGGMPMTGMPMTGMPMAAPSMAMVAQPTMGLAQMNVQGQMPLQQLLMMLLGSGQMSPQALQGLLMQAGAGGAQGTNLTQLLAQIQMSPQAAAALRTLLGGAAGTTPAPPAAPGGGTPGPTSAINSPREPVASSNPSGVTATAWRRADGEAGGAPSAAALQEQLRVAEQRLRKLEDLRRGAPP